MARRLAGMIALGALQLVSVVLAHELVFLARYGSRYGEALAHAGHGQAWTAAALTSLALAALLGGIGIVRLGRLGLLLRRAGGGGSRLDGLAPVSLARAWLGIAPRTAALSVLLLTAQENLERAALDGAMPGIGILLSPEYAGGLWITIGVGLVVGLLVALFEWRRRVLLARLRTLRARPITRSAVVARPRARVLSLAASILGRRSALRAPPLTAAA